MEYSGQGTDTPHYPKVVLVTGACRFLGGYPTARLAQNPLINQVIAVDAIAPSKDPGRHPKPIHRKGHSQ